MLKIGFIGFGQAGSLFADAAKEQGFQALAFNSAQIDLDVLEYLDSTERVHLNGYEGAGKDREIGEEAFLRHKELIEETIMNKFHDYHIIFPIFALGGGTGSGMAPSSIDLLTEMFEEKVISPILLFPHDKESLRAKMNTLESFAVISQNENIGATFILDNQKMNDLQASFTLQERYEYTRTSFLEFIQRFQDATQKHSKISNLDSMDLLTVFSERGCAIFSELTIDEDDITNVSMIGERLLHSFEYSSFVTTDYTHLSKVAFLGEYPSSYTQHITIDALFENISVPLEVFCGIYENENDNKLYTLTTGLPFPTNRLKTYETSIEQGEKNVMKSLSIARTQQYQNEQSWTQSLKRGRKIKI